MVAEYMVKETGMREFFTGLYGNDATKTRIGNAIIDRRMPHAFIIDGYEGAGKFTLATEIAAALNCEAQRDGNKPLPCRTCQSCKKILGAGHVDVSITERESGKAQISVEQIRKIRKDMYLTATEAEFKVYIIKSAERMNIEAQNALLIALEEPPRNVIIILLAEGTDKILTTIKSRSQYIAMERFSPEVIGDYLINSVPEAKGIRLSDEEGFRLATIGADGRIGMAKKLIMPKEREELYSMREETLAILNGVTGTYTEVSEAISLLPTERVALNESLERLMVALRDLIAVYYSEEAPLSFFTSYDEASEISYNIGIHKLYRLYDIILAAHEDLSKMANVNSLLSLISARIRTINTK